MAVHEWQLLHYGRLDRSPMSGSGPPSIGYLILFTEIGFTLLATTLIGVFVGNWLDGQLGSLPILSLLGFLVGAGTGAYGIYKLVSRFLATIE
jgi:hypothetical protein